MKNTLKNIDWNKVIKVIIVGSLVIVIAIGMTVICNHSLIVEAMNNDILIEGAKFSVSEPSKIIEGAKFFLK